MKRSFLSVLMLVIALCAYAQGTSPQNGLDIVVPDSDKITSQDYYSGKTAVRTGLEVYQVFLGHDRIGLANTQNEILGPGGRLKKYPIYKKTGEEAPMEYLRLLTFDQSIMNSIVKEVFPKCEISDVKTDKEIELVATIDMDTFKVIDMRIVLANTDRCLSLLAIPPLKIKQLERLVKEKCKGQFFEIDLGDPIYTERTRNASFSEAIYFIYFSKFSL